MAPVSEVVDSAIHWRLKARRAWSDAMLSVLHSSLRWSWLYNLLCRIHSSDCYYVRQLPVSAPAITAAVCTTLARTATTGLRLRTLPAAPTRATWTSILRVWTLRTTATVRTGSPSAASSICAELLFIFTGSWCIEIMIESSFGPRVTVNQGSRQRGLQIQQSTGGLKREGRDPMRRCQFFIPACGGVDFPKLLYRIHSSDCFSMPVHTCCRYPRLQ